VVAKADGLSPGEAICFWGFQRRFSQP